MADIERANPQNFIQTPRGKVFFENEETMQWARQQMSRRGGGGGGGGMDVNTLVQAGETVFAGMTAAEIKEKVKDAKRARKRLQKKQDAMVADARKNSALGPVFAQQLADVFAQQRKVDRSQSEALSSVVKAETVQAVGGGVRLVTQMTQSGAGIDGAATLVGAGALGFGIATIFADDDEDDDE